MTNEDIRDLMSLDMEMRKLEQPIRKNLVGCLPIPNPLTKPIIDENGELKIVFT